MSEEDNASADGGHGLCSKTCATLGVVFGPRSGYTRAISLLLILAMVSYVATGSADINYLYTRKMFAWTEAEYTEVTTGITGKVQSFERRSTGITEKAPTKASSLDCDLATEHF